MVIGACAGPEQVRDTAATLAFETTGTDAARIATNHAGSVWGAPATLERVGSIGLDEGPPELMFGQIADFEVTREHIYVLETKPPVVRKYTHDGEWVANLGRSGRGPGEFEWPSALAVDETDNRLYVKHSDPESLVSMDLEGGAPAAVPLPARSALRSWLRATPFGLARIGSRREVETLHDQQLTMQWLGRSGEVQRSAALPDYPAAIWTLDCGDGSGAAVPKPFAPGLTWALAADGGYVTGYPDRYEFTIHHPDGTTLTVNRYWSPFPVDREEYASRVSRAQKSAGCGDGSADWQGDPAPFEKAAYQRLFVDQTQRIWVIREGPGSPHDDCASYEPDVQRTTCWRSETLVDLFNPEGMYLGAVQIPDGVSLSIRPATHADKVLLLATSPAGSAQLVWYRIVPPPE